MRLLMTTYHTPERHVPADDLVDTYTQCPLCLSTSERVTVFTIQERPRIDWLYCDACKGYSASMMPTESYLQEYYRAYYTSDSEKVTISRPAHLAKHLSRLLPITEQRSLSILDFGGGDGTVAKLLAEYLCERTPGMHASITLVDFNQEPPHSTDCYSFSSHTSVSDVSHSTFDVILASAIVEHVPSAYELLFALFDLLAVGGIFYARTPHVTPVKKIYRPFSLKYPMHVHDLGPAFWNEVPGRYPHPLSLLLSQPSPVASGCTPSEILRTCLAYSLKLPAYLELSLRRKPTNPIWPFVGGWEVLLRREEKSDHTST